jgi:hypothetical protein
MINLLLIWVVRVLRIFKLRPQYMRGRLQNTVLDKDLTYSGQIGAPVMCRTVRTVTSIYAQVCQSPGLMGMKFKTLKATLCAFALLAAGTATADFGVGLKAGTLGIGVEGRWDPPVPWFDLRVGLNQYDHETNGDYAGINYDATLALDSYYLTGNFKFPATPLQSEYRG